MTAIPGAADVDKFKSQNEKTFLHGVHCFPRSRSRFCRRQTPMRSSGAPRLLPSSFWLGKAPAGSCRLQPASSSLSRRKLQRRGNASNVCQHARARADEFIPADDPERNRILTGEVQFLVPTWGPGWGSGVDRSRVFLRFVRCGSAERQRRQCRGENHSSRETGTAAGDRGEAATKPHRSAASCWSRTRSCSCGR